MKHWRAGVLGANLGMAIAFFSGLGGDTFKFLALFALGGALGWIAGFAIARIKDNRENELHHE